MWEMIERMASDRLWIYTALAGSLFGLAFSSYFQSTRLGLWLYAKFDFTVDYLVQRWGWTWLQDDPEAWRKRYPKVTHKIDTMENEISILKVKIKNLENGTKTKVIRQKDNKNVK